MTGEQALLELKQGNQRLRENRLLHPRTDPGRIRASASDQHPLAVVLACADSRVPPELIFDQGIGDLFTVRVAGNVANGDEIASIEFAVERLGAPLCVVMGHVGCGAIQEVLSGSELPLHMDQLFRQIKAVVATARRDEPRLSGTELANAVMRRNVFHSIAELRRHFSANENTLHIAGAEYRMDSGEVVWLESEKCA